MLRKSSFHGLTDDSTNSYKNATCCCKRFKSKNLARFKFLSILTKCSAKMILIRGRFFCHIYGGFFFGLKIRWIRIGILNKPLTFITAIQINNAHFVNQNPTVTLLDFMQKPLIKMMSKHFCHSLEDVVQIYEIGLRFFSSSIFFLYRRLPNAVVQKNGIKIAINKFSQGI